MISFDFYDCGRVLFEGYDGFKFDYPKFSGISWPLILAWLDGLDMENLSVDTIFALLLFGLLSYPYGAVSVSLRGNAYCDIFIEPAVG